MTLDEKSKTDLISYQLEKSDSAIADAVLLMDNKRFLAAVNRIYYALFYLVSAIAMKNNFVTTKHQTLIGWFNKNIINNGLLEKRMGKLVHKAFDSRLQADYGTILEFTEEELQSLYSQTLEFKEKIKELL